MQWVWQGNLGWKIQPSEPCHTLLSHAPILPAPWKQVEARSPQFNSGSAAAASLRVSQQGYEKQQKTINIKACMPPRGCLEPPRTSKAAYIAHKPKGSHEIHVISRNSWKHPLWSLPTKSAKAPWMKLHSFSVHFFGLDAVVHLRFRCQKDPKSLCPKSQAQRSNGQNCFHNNTYDMKRVPCVQRTSSAAVGLRVADAKLKECWGIGVASLRLHCIAAARTSRKQKQR